MILTCWFDEDRDGKEIQRAQISMFNLEVQSFCRFLSIDILSKKAAADNAANCRSHVGNQVVKIFELIGKRLLILHTRKIRCKKITLISCVPATFCRIVFWWIKKYDWRRNQFFLFREHLSIVQSGKMKRIGFGLLFEIHLKKQPLVRSTKIIH